MQHTKRRRLLLASMLLSFGMHIGAFALVCAFPSSSPPKLDLQLGDLSFNVDVVWFGEPNLGTGSGEDGDGSGDGLTLRVTRNTMPPAEDPRFMPTDAIPPNPDASATSVESVGATSTTLVAIDTPHASNKPSLTDAASPPPGPNIASSDTPDSGSDPKTNAGHDLTGTLSEHSETNSQPDGQRAGASNHGYSGADLPKPGHTESRAGTGQPSGASSVGGGVGIRSGVRFAGQLPPSYPIEAQRRGMEGEVMLWLEIGSDGAVEEVKLHHSSGHSLLDDAALRWAKSLRFVPARYDGERVPAGVFLPVRYRLVGR